MPWLVELLVPRAGAAGHTLDGTTLIESAAALSAAARADATTADEPAGAASRKFFGGAVGPDFAPIKKKKRRTVARVSFAAWDGFNRQLLASGASQLSLARRVRVLAGVPSEASISPARHPSLSRCHTSTPVPLTLCPGITPSRLWPYSFHG